MCIRDRKPRAHLLKSEPEVAPRVAALAVDVRPPGGQLEGPETEAEAPEGRACRPSEGSSPRAQAGPPRSDEEVQAAPERSQGGLSPNVHRPPLLALTLIIVTSCYLLSA
eukprot:2869776-Pyramimonas_sp.AAC.1